uniref:Peptidase S1 domain-containing protein n=1 Tax=Apteryx owenii TaxID=8824 RepID=A0A8B9SD03_APTOW
MRWNKRLSCGRHWLKKNRIVGGEEARSGKWPWQASLQMGAHGHVCGASVISNRWLISAAHCFLDSDSPNAQPTKQSTCSSEHPDIESIMFTDGSKRLRIFSSQ